MYFAGNCVHCRKPAFTFATNWKIGWNDDNVRFQSTLPCPTWPLPRPTSPLEAERCVDTNARRRVKGNDTTCQGVSLPVSTEPFRPDGPTPTLFAAVFGTSNLVSSPLISWAPTFVRVADAFDVNAVDHWASIAISRLPSHSARMLGTIPDSDRSTPFLRRNHATSCSIARSVALLEDLM